MVVSERTIAMYAGAVTELGDGCQLVLFDMPRIRNALPGFIVPHTNGTVYQNDLLEFALAPGGTICDGVSCERYRVNNGAWINCTGIGHEHEDHVVKAATMRALKVLKAFQDK